MDNMGAAKGEGSVENAAANPFEGGVVDNFGAFSKEQLPTQPENLEQLSSHVETSTTAEKKEAMRGALPATQPVTVPKKEDKKQDNAIDPSNVELQALVDTPVPRDAEQLPKAYMNNVVKIIEKNKKNPHQLVADLDVARWDLMKKAFDRNRGDGK
jgi:hypothetical protein